MTLTLAEKDYSSRDLFERRDGLPSARVTLAPAHFFFNGISLPDRWGYAS